MRGLPQLICILTSLFAMSSVTLATAATKDDDIFPKVSVLRPWELRKLTPPQKINYYRALQTLLTTLEIPGSGKTSAHNVLQYLFIPAAEAMARSGDDCVIGGYLSTWYRKPDGNLSCASPKEEQILDTPVAGTAKVFYCGGGEKARTAYCNSAVYLYAQENGERSCQSIDNFGTNCQKAFEARYGRQAGGDPHFPERLTRDLDRFSRTMSPEELNKYYSNFDSVLNRTIDENKFDKKSAEAIRSQIGIINKTRAVATSGAVADSAGPAPSAPASAAPAAGSGQTTSVIVNPTAAATSETTGLAKTSSPSSPQASAQAAPPAGVPAAVDPDRASEPPLPPAEEESKLLGKELSCVRDGLKALGYKPSERFLALIGTGIQAASGAYDSNQENSRKLLQTRVISMVQAYGFCDESSYPSNKFKTHELQLTRRWLNADGGKAQARAGLSYLQQMTDPASQAPRDFSAIFGLQPDGLAPFTREEKSWNDESLADRQNHISQWKGVRAKSEFESCHKNASERRSKDRRFRLQALRLPAVGPDGKRPPISDKQKKEVSEIQKATQEVCETMARACAIDAAKICGTEKLPVIPSMSAGIDGVTPKPPPAPAGTAPANAAPARQ